MTRQGVLSRTLLLVQRQIMSRMGERCPKVDTEGTYFYSTEFETAQYASQRYKRVP